MCVCVVICLFVSLSLSLSLTACLAHSSAAPTLAAAPAPAAQVQLKHWSEVETTISLAKMCLVDVEGYDKISPQLDEVLATASADREGRAAPLQFKREATSAGQDAASTARKAEQFKERGNSHYKQVRSPSSPPPSIHKTPVMFPVMSLACIM